MGGALGHGLATEDLEILDVLGHETAVLLGGPGEELVVGEADERRVGRDSDDVVPALDELGGDLGREHLVEHQGRAHDSSRRSRCQSSSATRSASSASRISWSISSG